MSLEGVTVLGSSVLFLLCHALLIEKLLIDCLMSSWDWPVLQKASLGLKGIRQIPPLLWPTLYT